MIDLEARRGPSGTYGRRSQALSDLGPSRGLLVGLVRRLEAGPGLATADGCCCQALRFRRRLRPPQPGPVSKPGQAPPAATLNISAYDLRQHFLFYPQCAK